MNRALVDAARIVSPPLTARVQLDWEGFTVEIDSRAEIPVVRFTPHTSQSYPEVIELTDEMFTLVADIHRLVAR